MKVIALNRNKNNDLIVVFLVLLPCVWFVLLYSIIKMLESFF